MKAIPGFFCLAAILLVTPGLVTGSGYEKGERYYERSGSYEKLEFYGTVEELPETLIGIWTVSGRPVQVTEKTYIEEEHGRVAIGVLVEIKGRQEGEIFQASKIEVKKTGR